MRAGWVVTAVACLSLLACDDQDLGPTAGPSSPTEVDSRTTAPRPSAAPPSAGPAAEPLLLAAPGGDGDSWKDTAGRQYRLGLINTPELSECYGGAAARKRRQLTAGGFRAASYAVDSYRRRVAVVYLPDGRNLNVWLARNGYADDRYLERFRGQNRSLAAQLEPAFAAAKRERLGLWAACRGAPPQSL